MRRFLASKRLAGTAALVRAVEARVRAEARAPGLEARPSRAPTRQTLFANEASCLCRGGPDS